VQKRNSLGKRDILHIWAGSPSVTKHVKIYAYLLWVFLPTLPSISSAPPKFFKISKIPFDYLRKLTDTTPSKILPDVDFRKSKYMTSGSQNISPEVDFQKSKYITGSQLPKVKIYHRKSTSGSQKIFSKVDF